MSGLKITRLRKNWRNGWKPPACLLSSLVLLSGCGGTAVATVEPFRMALHDVCISRDDVLTEKTAQAIEANNLALRRGFKRGSQCPKPTGKIMGPPAPAAAPEVPSTS